LADGHGTDEKKEKWLKQFSLIGRIKLKTFLIEIFPSMELCVLSIEIGVEQAPFVNLFFFLI
jgi:hypothetical protein